MGKKTKLREAQKLAAEQAIAARLRERAAAKPRRTFIESCSDFSADYRERIEIRIRRGNGPPSFLDTWATAVRAEGLVLRLRKAITKRKTSWHMRAFARCCGGPVWQPVPPC